MKHHIFMYHHVAPVIGREHLVPYIVSPDVFKKQLDSIINSGMELTTMADLIRKHNSQNQLRNRNVVLTFDDCSEELWKFAIPELEKRSIRATFYAVASQIDGENVWDDHLGGRRIPLMKADQLKQLAAMGHEVGSHAVSHRRLTELSDTEVLQELTTSRVQIEAITGVEVETLAYPFGAIPREHRRLCQIAGYKGACSIFSKSATISEDPFAIRRILLHEKDIGWRMRLKLSRHYLEWRKFRDLPSLR